MHSPEIKARIEQALKTGLKLVNNGKLDEARAVLNRALALSRKSKDRFTESIALRRIGQIALERDDPAHAKPWIDQALGVAQRNGDRAGIANAIYDQGLVEYSFGRYFQSLPFFERSLEMFQELKLTSVAASDLQHIGFAYNRGGDYERAGIAFDKALKAFEDLREERKIATTQQWIGINYDYLGQNQKALVYFKKSLATMQRLRFEFDADQIRFEMADCYLNLGQYDQALEACSRALVTLPKFHNPAGVGICYYNSAVAYRALGRDDLADEAYRKCTSMLKSVQSPRLNAILLNYIGDAYHELGQNQLALAAYVKVLKMDQDEKRLSEEALVLVSMGNAFAALGQTKNAIGAFTRGSEVFAKAGSPTNAATAKRLLGSVHLARNEFTFAVRDYIAALPAFEADGERRELAETNLGIAKSFNGLGETETAILFGKQAVDQYQSLRQSAVKLSKDTRKAFTEKVSGAYRAVADMLIRQGRIAEAERVLGLLKDDERFEFLRRDPTVKGVLAQVEFVGREQGWIKRWRAIEHHAVSVATVIRDLEAASAKAQREGTPFKDEAKLQAAILDQETAESAMSAFFHAIKAESADQDKFLAEIRQRELEAFRSQVQGPLRRLEASTHTSVAAVYGLMFQGYLHFIVATVKGEIPISVKVEASDLNRTIADLRAALTDPGKDPKLPGKRLYDLVLANPIKQLHAAGIHHVMWSLDGALRYIPIAAVWDGTQYLLQTDSYTVYSPLELEKLDAERDSNPRVAGFGASKGATFEDRIFVPLPNVKREIDAVVKNPRKGAHGTIIGDPWLDAEFTRKIFLTQMGSDYYRISHIASHFDLRGDFVRSALLTGDQKLLSLRDMLGTGGTLDEAMRKKPWAHLDLVVLSACDTAEASANIRSGNSDKAGSETDSFASVVLGLGASSVMASLWSVSDASTSVLMDRFYRNWVSGMTKADALRQAQLSMLRGTNMTAQSANLGRSVTANGENGNQKTVYRLDHPYYWAPFVLYGNWR